MSTGTYYDIELIDIDPNVDNFTFEGLSQKDLEKVIEAFKEKKPFIEFKSNQGANILEREYFRGVMYAIHEGKHKTVAQETMESAEEIGKIEIVKNKNKPQVISKE